MNNDSSRKTTMMNRELIQHHHDIRDNFSQPLSSTSKRKQKLLSSAVSQPSLLSPSLSLSTKISSQNDHVQKLKNATRIPTMILRPKQNNQNSSLKHKRNHKNDKFIMESSFLHDSSLLYSHTTNNDNNIFTDNTSWPRWNKNKKQNNHPVNDTSDTDGDYLFGPQFLSNRGRHTTHILKDKIIVDDDDDDIVKHNPSIQGEHQHKNREHQQGHDTRKGLITMSPRPNNTYPHDNNGHPTSANSDYSPYSNSPYFRTRGTTSRKRRKKQVGNLTKLLHSIGNSIESDWVRFQSGSYPYRDLNDRQMDFNDPRNRAETVLDITVLGYPVPFISHSDKVAVLACVHSYSTNVSKGRVTNIQSTKRTGRFRHTTSSGMAVTQCSLASIERDKLRSREDQHHHDVDEYSSYVPRNVWLCFTRETITEHSINVGTELRIYNTIIFNVSLSSKQLPVVLCTRLCEPCPKKLPPMSIN